MQDYKGLSLLIYIVHQDIQKVSENRKYLLMEGLLRKEKLEKKI